jgi:zinc D-Ala-D-Ala dipeptidase
MILLSDPRVAAVPVREPFSSGAPTSGVPIVPLVRLGEEFGPAGALVRADLGERLRWASAALPPGVSLRVVEGHRPIERQRQIIAAYAGTLRAADPGLDEAELRRLTSRFVAPVEVAPHVAGAAVDLTLTGPDGDLDMGTPIDATPEESGGACYFAADTISAAARANRTLLARVLGGAGLVNYPTEWWHWSYGDRYWALMTGAPAALHGPLDAPPVGQSPVGQSPAGQSSVGESPVGESPVGESPVGESPVGQSSVGLLAGGRVSA